MKCKQIQEQLNDYLDRELPKEQMGRISAHLSQCPQCAKELRALGNAWEGLLVEPGIEPSPDFSGKFWQRLRREEEHAAERVPVFVRILKWAPAMAAGFLIAFFAGWFAGGGGREASIDNLAASDIALLREYEIIQHLDLLKDMPVLEFDDINGEGGAQ